MIEMLSVSFAQAWNQAYHWLLVNDQRFLAVYNP